MTAQSRCSVADCFGRGFSIDLDGKTAVSRATHLQHVIGGLQVPSLPLPTNLPPQSEAEPVKRNVSYTGNVDFLHPQAYQKRMDSFDLFANIAITSESGTPEDWSDQNSQMQTLFGLKRRASQRDSPNDHGQRKHRRKQSRSLSREKKKQSRKHRPPSSSTSIESRVKVFRKSLSRRKPREGSNYETSSAKSSPRKCLPRGGGRSGSSLSSSSGRETIRSTKSKGSAAKLPSFLKQPLPRGTEAPVELRDDPKLHKRRNQPCESAADDLVAIVPNPGVKDGESDATYPKLLERTIFALRGFGEFEVSWGIGQYGKSSTDYIRRIGDDNVEDLRVHNARCKITNRSAIGISTLKLGSLMFGLGRWEELATR